MNKNLRSLATAAALSVGVAGSVMLGAAAPASAATPFQLHCFEFKGNNDVRYIYRGSVFDDGTNKNFDNVTLTIDYWQTQDYAFPRFGGSIAHIALPKYYHANVTCSEMNFRLNVKNFPFGYMY